MAAWRRTSSLSFSKRCSRDSFKNTCRTKFKVYQEDVQCSVTFCLNLTLVLPNCHSFLVLSYLVRRSVLLFLSSPAADTFSFRMILYLSGRRERGQSVRDNKRDISTIISQRVQIQRHTYREKKSLKVLRTGNPARRIFTVSNIPEYLSWFRTTSGSNTFGFYK